ncbi:hypothetical protein AB0P02_28095 [Streptomyces griseoluteus]|uniref:hypothetical protein n=1 Tax=Streptomyces TaxID=1883 RepID=UPI000A386E0C|nr:hypothetical protein [Streptomyces recifensis]
MESDEDRLKASASRAHLADEIRHSGWNRRDAAAVAEILQTTVTNGTDLRTIELPDETHFGLRMAFFDAATFPLRWIELHHFDRPEDLGPLADARVYGTDLHGEYAGWGYGYGGWGLKSHNPVHCASGRIEQDCMRVPTGHWRGADCITLATFLYRTPGFRGCSFCGGAVIQRLTDEQHTHYARSCETSTARPWQAAKRDEWDEVPLGDGDSS